MDAYTIFKFLHVLTAICWAGGGLALLFLGIFAERKGDRETTGQTMAVMGKLGTIWFVPMSMLTVIFGVIMAFLGNLWGELWVVLGLAGFAVTFCTGNFILKPRGDKAAALVGEGKFAEAEKVGREILQAAKFDYTLMFVIIALMVFKPAFSDLIMLAILAVILAAGAVLFLVPLLKRSAVQAA